MADSPRILDSAGTPLKVGDRVFALSGPAKVIGLPWVPCEGWRVEVRQPDSAGASIFNFPAEAAFEPSTYHCAGLTRITDQEEKRDD